VLEDLAIKQETLRWGEHEIRMQDDFRNWKTMSSNEQHFIKQVLSFSVISDGLVNKNLLERFLAEITDPSAQKFYLFQAVMEHVHMRTYGIMLSSVIIDNDELEQLLHPDENNPAIRQKINWIEKWILSDKPIGIRLAAFAIIEGLFFSSLFCSFFWLKHKGSKLPGMIQANEFISRDEGLHCQFAIALLQYINNKPTIDEITQMIREAVNIEHIFIDNALPVNLIGMNSNSMKKYVEFVADKLIVSIPLINAIYAKPVFNTSNPFLWMESISLPNQTNFFERAVTEYQDSKYGKTIEETQFCKDIADF
jgi:ribonucleotide reductase beta subunit family protein with ferritin-like domain